LQQTLGGEAFPTESAAVCRLQSAVYAPVETFLSKKDQVVVGESIKNNQLPPLYRMHHIPGKRACRHSFRDCAILVFQ